MKTNNPITKSLIAVLLVALVATGGCKNFMSNNDDFKKTIQTEVAVANADQVPVRVIAVSGTGTSSPAGQVTEKVTVPFSLLMTPDSAYGFIRWAAYSTTDLSAELGSEIISFADKAALETTATLNVTRDDIQIQPVCEKRPKLSTTSPQSGATGVFRNVPIRIYFSKPINISSFTYDDGTKRSGGLLKNLNITGFIGSQEPAARQEYFKDPVLNSTGKILTLNPASTLIPSGTTLTIEFSKGITDTSGLAMADADSVSFRYGSGKDDVAPVITSVNAGTTSNVYWNDDIAYRHFRYSAGTPLYIVVAANDKVGGVSGSGLMLATLTEKYEKDPNGSVVGTSYESSEYGLTYEDDYNAELGDPYKLLSSGDGLISLNVTVTDATSNVSTPLAITFVRDTTAPVPVANASNLATPPGNSIYVSGQTSGGYFNAGTSATATFTPGTLADYGSTYCDPSVYYSVGFNPDGTTGWTGWKTAASSIAVSGVSDGNAVPVYFKLKDGLGNESAITQLTTVKRDTVAPTASVEIQGTDTYPGTTLKTLKSSGVKTIALTATDGLSGMGQYFINTSPFDSTPPASLTTGWSDISSGSASSSATFVAGEGSRSVYVWYKDKADNVTLATDTITIDTNPPTINKFFVQPTTAFASAPSSLDKQYSPTQDVYFVLEATDGATGTGLGGFCYSVDGGSDSQWFDFSAEGQTWTVNPQGTDPLVAANVMKTAKDVTGKVTVFGKLRLPSANGNHTVTVKVRDYAMLPSVSANSNVVMYDSTAPETLSATVNPQGTHYTGSSYEYVKSATQKYTVHLEDAGSGVWKAVLAGVSGSDMLTSVTSSLISTKETASNDFSVDTTLTSSDGPKALTVTGYDQVGNPRLITLGATKTTMYYVDNTPPTFEVRLQSDSLQSVPFGTNSSSGSILLFGPTQSSKTWSSFYTYLVTLAETGSGLPSGDMHQMILYRLTPAQVETLVSAGKLHSTATGYAGNLIDTLVLPGLTGMTGYTAQDGATSLVTSSSPVSVTHNLGKTITLPTTTTTAAGKALSGYYITGFIEQDNLTNTSPEQQIGYFYDQTPPAFVGAGLIATNWNGDIGYLDSSTGIYYVKESTTPGIVLRAYATDRPSTDTGGSGIVTATVRVLNSSGVLMIPERELSIASGNVKFVGGDSVIYETGDKGVTSFIVPNNDGSYNKSWIQSGNYYDVRLTDASGNFVTSTHTSPYNYTIGVMIDNTAPTMTYTFTMGTSSHLIDSTVYGNAPAISDLTLPSDGTGSGVKGWLLDDIAAATTSSSWTTTSLDTSANLQAAMQSKINTLLVDNSFAPKALYVHLIDNAGNIWDQGLDGTAGHLFKYDNVAPVFDTTNHKDVRIVTDTAGLSAFMKRNGAFFRTTANLSSTAYALAYVTDTRSETGANQSGIYSVANALSVINGTISGTTTSGDVTTKTGDYDKGTRSVVYDNGITSSPVLVYSLYDTNFTNNYGPHQYLNLVTSFKDAAGNQSSTVTTKLYTDVTAPDSATVTIPAGYGSGTVFYKTAPTPTALTLTDAPFNATYQLASGVKGFVLTTSLTPPTDDTAIEHPYDEWGYDSAAYQAAFNTSWTGKTTNGWYRYTGTPADLTNAQAALATILNNTSAQTVYIHVVDYAGNVYSPSTPVLSNAKLDTTPTVVGSCKLYGTNTSATIASGEPSYTSSAAGQVAIMQFTEAVGESGLKKVTLSGDLDLTTMVSTNPAVDYSSDGTAFTSIASTYSGGVITLTTSQTSGYLRIRNIAFTPGSSGSGTDGDRTLYVVAEDAVQNDSSGASAKKTDSITLDTVVPTATMWIKRSDNKGAQIATAETSDTYTTSQLVTVHVKYTETGTGLSTLTFAGSGYSDLSTITSVKNSGGSDVSYTKAGNVLTLTGNPTGAGAELVITGFTVSTSIDSAHALTVTPKDFAGGSGTAAGNYITCDTTLPTITSPGISNVISGYIGTSATVSATLSGQTYYRLSTTTPYANDSAGYTAITDTGAGGTSFGSASLSQAITSSSYYSTGSATQLYLNITDAAGNIVSSPVGSSLMLDDNGPGAVTVTAPASTIMSGTGTSSSDPYKIYSQGATINLSGKFVATDSKSGTGSYVCSPVISDLTASAATSAGSAYTVTAYDNVGNAGTATYIKLYQKTTGPTITVNTASGTNGFMGTSGNLATNGTTCFSKGVTVSVTPADIVGVASYFIEASSAVRSDFTTGVTWQSKYSDGTTDVASSVTGSVTLPLLSSATNIWIYFKDGLGNISSQQLKYDATYTQWALDSDPPTVTTAPAVSATNNMFYTPIPTDSYLKAGTILFKLADSGVGKGDYIFTATSDSPSSWTTGTLDKDYGTWTAGTNVVTSALPAIITSTGSTVWLHYRDAVGTEDKVQVVSGTVNKWFLDTDGPGVTTLNGSETTVGDGGYFKVNGSTPTMYYRTSNTGYSVTLSATGLSDTTNIYGFGTTTTPSSSTTVTLKKDDSTKIYVFDNVGNYTDVTVAYTLDNSTPAPTVASYTPSAATQVVYASGMYNYKDTGGVTFTLTSTESESGIMGFSKTNIYSSASTGTINLEGTTDNTSATTPIYGFDNAGNSNSFSLIVMRDTKAPTIDNTSLTGDSNSITITGVSDAGCGLDLSSVTISGVSSGTGSYTTNTLNLGSGIAKGATELVTFIIKDKFGNSNTTVYLRSRDATSGVYTITINTNGNPSMVFGSTTIASRLDLVTENDKIDAPQAMTYSGKELLPWNSINSKMNGKRIELARKNSQPMQNEVSAVSELASNSEIAQQNFSTLSNRHTQALALARSQFVASQNTDAAQNAADKKISPETANNVKQDDSGRSGGVGYNQEYVRLACNAMAPLAERYFASHGVQLVSLSDVAVSGGSVQSAILQASSQHDSGQSNGLPSGPGIGMLCQPKDFWVFRREPGIVMVS